MEINLSNSPQIKLEIAGENTGQNFMKRSKIHPLIRGDFDFSSSNIHYYHRENNHLLIRHNLNILTCSTKSSFVSTKYVRRN